MIVASSFSRSPAQVLHRHRQTDRHALARSLSLSLTLWLSLSVVFRTQEAQWDIIISAETTSHGSLYKPKREEFKQKAGRTKRGVGGEM